MLPLRRRRLKPLALATLFFASACTEALDPDTPQAAKVSVPPNAAISDLPPSGTWTSRPPMPAAVYGHAMTTLNGKVYSIGGALAIAQIFGIGAVGTDAVSVYDPSTDSWSSVASLPFARVYPNGASVIDGKIYVPGGAGCDGPGCGETDALLIFDPTAGPTGTWTSGPPMPIRIMGGQSGVIDGQLYVLAGWSVGAPRNRFFRFDPPTQAWTELTGSPAGHTFGASAVVNGKFYATGGEGSVHRFDIYDPTTGTWTNSTMPVGYQHHTAVAVDGRLVLVGGSQWIGGNYLYDRVVSAYDPSTSEWTTATPVPNAGATYNGISGQAVTFSGSSSAVMSLVPDSRNLAAATALGSELFITGGSDSTNTIIYSSMSSVNPPGAATLTYTWDFGDGNTGNGPTPSHTYTSAGSYNVTLTVSAPDGRSAVATTQAEISGMHTVTINPGAFSGTWQVLGGILGPGSGTRNITVNPGTYTINAGSVAEFSFTLNPDGNVVSNNAVAATGGYHTLTFNTVAVAIDPQSFALPYIVYGYNTYTAGARTLALVPGLTHSIDAGAAQGGSTFQFTIAGDGTVTSLNPSSAIGGAAQLTFNNATIAFSTGSFMGAWKIFHGPAPSSGDRSIVLIPGLTFGLEFGLGLPESQLYFAISGTGVVTPANTAAASGGALSLTLQNSIINVTPSVANAPWGIHQGPSTSGAGDVTLVPGLSFALTSSNAPGALDVFALGDPCNITPSQFVLAGATYTLACGPLIAPSAIASVWIGLKNGADVGTMFDFLVEVLRNGAVVASGQLNGQNGGSSGFNNAILRVIDASLASVPSFGSGDALGIRLSVRIAEGVSGHPNGTARLWFDDAGANSRVALTLNGALYTYYLRTGFVLSETAGTGPLSTIDVKVHRHQNGNAFEPFGTWVRQF